MTFEVILHLMKKLRLYIVDILEKFLKDCVLNKNIMQKKKYMKFF